MTTVNTIPTPKAAPLGNTPAITSNSKLGRLLHTRIIQRRYPALTTPKPKSAPYQPVTDIALIQAQVAIENALSMALYLVRNQQTPDDLQQATAKALRACTLLKHQCEQRSASPDGFTPYRSGRA